MTALATDTGRHLDGFEVPIHHTLGAPLLLGGAPRGLAIINGTLAAAVGLGLSNGWPGCCSGPSATASR